MVRRDGVLWIDWGIQFGWKSENVSTTGVAKVNGRYRRTLEASVCRVLVPGHEGRVGCAAVDLEPLEKAKSVGQIRRSSLRKGYLGLPFLCL